MKKEIQNCKFVVVPSIWYENCPYSVLETLAVGKPIIGANIGGIPELINNNENGFTYKYDDTSDLADKMRKLFENEKVVNDFSKKSKELAIEKYSREDYYKQIEKIYKDLLERSR